MKAIKLLILFIATAVLHAGAQTYKIDSSEISFENKLRPCFDVKYDAPAKTVKQAWDKFFKKNYGVKITGIGFLTNKDIITGNDVTIPAISDKRMDMYARVTDIAGGSELKYFMSFGYDFFIGPTQYPKEFEGMKKILNDFSMDFLNEYYADEANSITKKMKGYEKDISKNNRLLKRNSRKARKGSAEVANGYSAKNTSLNMENEELKRKISDLNREIETVKLKQQGITRN